MPPVEPVQNKFSTQADNQLFLSGQGAMPPAGEQIQLTGGAGSGVGTGQGQQADTAPPPSQGQPTEQAGPSQVFQGSGPVQQRLLGGVLQPAQQQRAQVQDISRNFYQEAGPQRTYESIGGQQTLDRALQPGEAIDPARNLVNASYQGPQSLDSDQVGDVYKILNQAQGLSSGLTGTGLASYVQQSTPGLTRGESAFESQQLQKDPDYMAGARQAQQEVSQVYNQLRQAQARATQYAADRRAQEEGIADLSRNYLEDRRGDVLGSIDARIQEENQRRKTLDQLYGQFAESGALEDLQAIPQEYLSFDPNDFDTERRQTAQAAEARWNEIMGQFPDIADTPTLQLGIDSHGRETPKLWETPDDVAYRQGRLQEQFSPGTQYSNEGQFGNYIPLYFGGENPLENKWVPPEVANYVHPETGTLPSRQNLSTEEQRTTINRINEILNQADRLEEAGQPFVAASIAAEVDRYLADEEASFAARSETLDNESAAWKKKIEAARRAYKKRQEKKAWGTVSRILGGIVTIGGSELVGGQSDIVGMPPGKDFFEMGGPFLKGISQIGG